MSYEPRHPTVGLPALKPGPYPASLASTKLSPGLLGKMAEAFSVALSTVERSLSSLPRFAAAEQQAALDAARAEVARLEDLGVRVQELARVLSGDAPVPAERVDLADAVRRALVGWSHEAASRGVALVASDAPCPVDINAAVLEQLLDLALDHAMQIGSRIAIDANDRHHATRPTLTIEIFRRHRLRADDDDGADELHWLLFAQLARALGLVAQRHEAARTVTLALVFPDPDGSIDDEIAAVAAPLPHTADASGRHVLVIEPQDIARVHVHRLLSEVGMHVDSAASVGQARTGPAGRMPDLVVTGLAVDDPPVRALLEEIRKAQPRLRVIELVDDDNAFAFSMPGTDAPARVSRHDVARTLVRAVAQELDGDFVG